MLSWDEFETPESVKKPTEQEKQAAPVTTAEAKEEKPEETHKEQPKINIYNQLVELILLKLLIQKFQKLG